MLTDREISQKLPNRDSCDYRTVTPTYGHHPSYQVWLRSDLRCGLQPMPHTYIHTYIHTSIHTKPSNRVTLAQEVNFGPNKKPLKSASKINGIPEFESWNLHTSLIIMFLNSVKNKNRKKEILHNKTYVFMTTYFLSRNHTCSTDY